jgi:gamma-glutamyl hercynylcysteine S-oxide synthase
LSILQQRFDSARKSTLSLISKASEDLAFRSPGEGFRPLIWHFGHIAAFEWYWILHKLAGLPSINAEFELLFDPIKTPRESSKTLPELGELLSYATKIREYTIEIISNPRTDESDYLFKLVIEHELQHQETITYLLHMLGLSATLTTAIEVEVSRDMVKIPAGRFVMGCVWDIFAYDNELPAHEVDLPEFSIDACPATVYDFSHFIKENGYNHREFWSDEGWSCKERNDWSSPEYWHLQKENLNHPVYGLSWYEASAYARFCAKRLPSEAEWERAASWDGDQKRLYSWGDSPPSRESCNFGDLFGGTTPVGLFPKNFSGCYDLTGNVWEWTSDPFRGFKGFQAFPYKEYSEGWFDDDHRVLKGGSWATRSNILRTSFRNFFRRDFRIGFNGVRCVSD